MIEEIRHKVHNIDLVIDDIKKFPQTYNTILQELKTDGTCQTILRRKLNRSCKDGSICKTSIPGTRFGKVIFFCVPKDYYILIEAGRMGSVVYCFFGYVKINRYWIQLNDYWILEDGFWIKNNIKMIFEGNVLKWI